MQFSQHLYFPFMRDFLASFSQMGWMTGKFPVIQLNTCHKYSQWKCLFMRHGGVQNGNKSTCGREEKRRMAKENE